MSTLIFIGGPTASGKSSIIDALKIAYPNSKNYRRVQGFFDLAQIRNISDNEIFSKISSEDVDDNFVDVCQSSSLIISDVHYAVQLNRNKKIDIYESYVPTISESLIQKLKNAGVKIVAIFLECNPEILLTRARYRFANGQKELRNISIKDCEIESEAEKREFYNLLEISDDGIVIDSEHNDVDNIVNIVGELIDQSVYKKVLKKEN